MGSKRAVGQATGRAEREQTRRFGKGHGERPLPEFFLEWRSGWEPAGESFTPMNYFIEDSAVPAVIMAAWLFCPETTVYAAGVYLTERFDPDNVDDWLTQLEGDVPSAERKVNMLVLDDVFGSADLDPYSEDELQQLAEAIGECWRGVLTRRYPDRSITVQVTGEDQDAYGPTVTFWTD